MPVLQMLFADKMVTYDTFMNDLAARLAYKLHTAQSDPEYISQRKAYELFGRRNVERWRRAGKIEPSVRPNRIEYRTAELRLLQAAKQDYLIL